MNPQEDVDVTCPCCGESIRVSVDCTAGPQEYVEDCQVCCRPLAMRVTFDASGPVVAVRPEDDA